MAEERIDTSLVVLGMSCHSFSSWLWKQVDPSMAMNQNLNNHTQKRKRGWLNRKQQGCVSCLQHSKCHQRRLHLGVWQSWGARQQTSQIVVGDWCPHHDATLQPSSAKEPVLNFPSIGFCVHRWIPQSNDMPCCTTCAKQLIAEGFAKPGECKSIRPNCSILLVAFGNMPDLLPMIEPNKVSTRQKDSPSCFGNHCKSHQLNRLIGSLTNCSVAPHASQHHNFAAKTI